MKKVIEGTDQGGITKAVNWNGGGGFRYHRLAPSLLEKVYQVYSGNQGPG
jgi:adenine-specific DNA-methyltransferase